MKKRIMVVDDDKITLKMCKFILEKQDHEVVTAESGKRCLEFLREPSNPRIDCILLDIETIANNHLIYCSEPVCGGEPYYALC